MASKLGQRSLIADVDAINTLLLQPSPAVSGTGSTHNPVTLDATLEDIMSIGALTQILSGDMSRGDLWIGDSTPKMVALAHPGAAGYALTTDGDDVLWDQTPLWTGLHTFNAGWTLDNTQVGTVGAGSYLSELGIRATLANAEGLYVPWIAGDADATAQFGSLNAANNQRAIEALSYSNYAVYAETAGAAAAIYGKAAAQTGIYGESADATEEGVFGYNSAGGVGVGAQGTTGTALHVNLTGAGTAIASFQDNGGNIFDILDGGNILLTAPATLDLNGIADCLILDTDADTTISAPTDDQIDIEIAGADDFTFTANSLNVLSGSYITMADDTWVGLGAAAGRIEFDDQATDEVNFRDCTVSVNSATIVAGFDMQINGQLLIGSQAGAVTGVLQIEEDTNAFASNLLDVQQNPTTEGSGQTVTVRAETSNYGMRVRQFGTGVVAQFIDSNDTTQGMTIANGGNVGFGAAAPGSLTEWNFADDDLEFVDAHAASAVGSISGVIEVQRGGATEYIALYDGYTP